MTELVHSHGCDLYGQHHRNTVAHLSRDTTLGFNCVSAYLLATCALKLGFGVTFFRTQQAACSEIPIFLPRFNRPSFFQVAHKKRKVHFWGSASEKDVSLAGVRLSSSKSLSKSAFERRGVQTPRGGLATSGNLNVLTELDRQGVNRLVVKPDRGSGSTDVFADKNIEEAMDIILCRPNKSFVVEEYIEGHEFRVQLVANKSVFAVERRPQFVTGDGVQTLDDLITARIEMRKRNPSTRHRNFDAGQADFQISKQNLRKKGVPAKGKVISLATHSVVGDITDNINITQSAPSHLLELAEAAGRSVGVSTGSVDIRQDEKGQYHVLEVNAKSGIDMFCYPLGGTANWTVPLAILVSKFSCDPSWVQPDAGFDFLKLTSIFRDGGTEVFPVESYAVAAPCGE